MSSRLVVKSHEPNRLRLAIALLVTLLVVAAWGLFEWGRKAAGYDRVTAARVRGELNDRITELETDNDGLRHELALLRTSDRVDQEAYSQVSVELDDLQSQIAELNEELAFYRGIMSPSDGRSGLQIKAVQINPVAEDRSFNLRLILVQAGRHDARVTGGVEVTIVGESDETPDAIRIDLAALTSDAAKLRYSFRYFQILERDISLPEGFEPSSVDVSLTGGRKSDSVSASFPWQVTDS